MAREIAILTEVARQQHPNIVRYLGFAVHGGDLCLLLRLANAGNMATFLASNNDRLILAHLVGICEHIARGMLYLHSFGPSGLLHGDLKVFHYLFFSYSNQ